MTMEVFGDIFNGLLQGFGSVWLVVVFLVVAGVALLVFAVNLEPIYALVALSVPLMMYVIYSTIQIGWALGLIVIGMGLMMAIALYRIFQR
jgi:hypothetical protein